MEVSRALGTSHSSVTIDGSDIESQLLDAVYHGERPVFRSAPVPLYRLSQAVRGSDIRVVLTGEGADEYLYGYDSFKELQILSAWKREGDGGSAPDMLRRLYPHLSHYADATRFGMIKMYYEGFLDSFENELGALNIRAHNNRIIARYLHPDLQVDDSNERLLERLRQQLPPEFQHWSMLQRNSYLEIRTLLAGYLLSSQGDRMALGHGIEGRYPFLDHRLVDLVFHLPDDYKLHDFQQKRLLCDTFRKRIPDFFQAFI